jgi:membrane-anchored protein YejM (alkaline phosphatase superfamily)
MKAASISIVKKELSTLPPKEVLEICMRLAKYKKENKELLSYLLFEANDEQQYIVSVKHEIDAQFAEINRSTMYYIKKSIRKILKMTHKYIRYSGIRKTEVELLLYFCTKLKTSGISINSSTALSNIYQSQIQKIRNALGTLHEDLQYDYEQELKIL